IIENQEKKLKQIENLNYPEKEAPDTAYVEADATFITLQNRGKKKKEKMEVKLGVGYTGKEPRYIVKEVMSFVALAVAALTIMLIMQTLFELMDMLINKRVAWPYIVKLLAYRLPAFLVVTFPISLLASSELAIGRLSTDGEITAMRAGGISLRRIMLPFLTAALAISILAFVINDYIVPEANHISQNIIREIVLKKGPPNIRRNVFFRDAENRYFYINRLDEKNMIMQDIMIYEMTREKFPRMITAKSGKWVIDTWKLENGTIYNYDKDGKITYEMSFTNMDIIVKEDLQNSLKSENPQE
ncbi:unnamed protein product, partial [marine sediment metagenome]